MVLMLFRKNAKKGDEPRALTQSLAHHVAIMIHQKRTFGYSPSSPQVANIKYGLPLRIS